MTTQTINGAAVEIVVILADGKTDPAATLDAREAATVAAVDLALRADAAFQAAYPSAALVRVDSMRGVEETRNGRYYLRYRYAGGVTEFWGHVGQQAKIDFKKGSVGGGCRQVRSARPQTRVLPPRSGIGLRRRCGVRR